MSKKRAPKRKTNSLKKLLVCVIIVGLIVGGYFIYKSFKPSDETKTPKVVDEIKSFNYVVNEKDTKLFKKLFGDLKKVLSAKEVDNKKYAEAIAKLFVADFFSLENKTSKNDVGGVQFVYSTYKTDFIDYARDGIYKQVKNKLDNNNKQVLPVVTAVNVSKVEDVDASSIFESVSFEGDNAAAYEVTVDWEYKNGSGFQDKAVLTIVHDKDKLSIAQMEE